MLTLRLEGEENFYRSCIRIERKVEEQSVEFLDEMGQFIVSTIRDNWSAQSPSNAGAPPAIDSGNLDSAITTETRGGGGRFASKSDAQTMFIRFNTLDGSHPNGYNYAQALEEGTYRMAARPFLQPAMERAKDIAPYIAQRTFRL
jgi:hypothetical protein